MAGRKTISVVIDATENLSAKARKGAEALQGVGKKGKAGLSKVQQWAARAEKQLRRLAPVAEKVKRALKAVGVIGAAALAGLLAIGIKALKMWGAQEDAVFSLEAAMRSAGNYTPELSKRYQDLAASLQQVTKYGDEAIMPLMGMLTQIGKVSEKDMPRATEAVLDLSEAMGVDLKAGALLVAKAAAGEISMLKRYGIMVDMQTYKTEGFSAVLDALSNQFGGTARAKALTLVGAYTQLKNKIGDMFELIGKKLAPVARLLIDALDPVIDGISEWVDKSDDLNVIISETARIANMCAQAVLGLGIGFTFLLNAIAAAKYMFKMITLEELNKQTAMFMEWEEKIGVVAVELDALTKKIEGLMLGGGKGKGEELPRIKLPGIDLSDVIPTEEIEQGTDALQIFLDKLDQLKEAKFRKDIEDLAESAFNLASNFELVNERLPRTNEMLAANAELQERMSAEADRLGEKLRRIAETVTVNVQDLVVNTFMAIGDFIANVVAGVGGAGKRLAATVLNVFGTMAQQIGAVVVATSKAIAALQTLNVVAGIGLGLSLIVLGGVLKGIASRLSAQGSTAPAMGGGRGGASGAGYFRQPAAGTSRGPAPETRFFFILDGGRPREGTRHEAESYLERTMQGSTKRTFKRMVRTDELAFS